MSLSDYIARLRHRKGFGVHSPFAFTFLADTVGYPGHYYDDILLAEACDGLPRRLRRLARLVHRTVARMSPRAAVITQEVPAPLVVGAMLADSRLKPTAAIPAEFGPRTLMVATAPELSGREDILSRLLAAPDNILILTGTRLCPAPALQASEALRGGWQFSDTDTSIFISSDRTAPVELRVKLV